MATLAGRLGIEELVNESVWLGCQVPGAALPGRKVMSLLRQRGQRAMDAN